MPTKGNIQLGNGEIFFNGLSVGIATISECDFTTEGDIVEKDFRVLKFPSEATFKCSAKKNENPIQMETALEVGHIQG